MTSLHLLQYTQLTKYLRLIGGYRFYQFTALPYMATVPLQFTKVAKEVKLMFLAEGISIRQYINRRLANKNELKTAMPRKHLLAGASCRKPGLDHKFLKIRFISNSSNRICWLQFDLWVGLVLSKNLPGKTVHHVESFSLIYREAHVTLKA